MLKKVKLRPEYQAAHDAFDKSYKAGNTTYQALSDALHAYEKAKFSTTRIESQNVNKPRSKK